MSPTDSATGAMQDVILRAVQDAVKDASTRGWEAIILVLVMLGLICLTGFIIKWLIRSMDRRMEEATNREERMAKRLSELESFVQITLLKTVNDTSAMAATVINTVNRLSDILGLRTCVLDAERQEEVVDRLASGLANRGMACPSDPKRPA